MPDAKRTFGHDRGGTIETGDSEEFAMAEMINWNHLSVDEVKANSSSALAIGPFGSRMKADCYTPFGVPVIRGNNISETKGLTGEFVHISEEKAKELTSSHVYDGDLVFPHRGLIGEVGIVTGGTNAHYVISSSLMKLTCNRKIVDPLFLFYFFRSSAGKYELLKNASQVGTPGIATPLSSLRAIQVPVPPLPEQRAIAHILGTLDDKIELNRRMNEALEALARAIFKSWFVDFDPVRAKMEGRQPAGMDAETAALFPDEFEDSALGQIPKGWKAGTLGEIAQNVRRGARPEDISPSTLYIGLEHMPRQSIALAEWGTVEEVTSNKSWFKQGDILFGKLRPYFHKVGVAAIDGVCSTDILVIAPTLPEWYGPVLFHVSSVELVNHTNAASTGTKMPRASWQDIARYEIAIPPPEIVNAFSQQALAIVQKIRGNIMESRTLATLRDTLLPKLLSGEVRVMG